MLRKVFESNFKVKAKNVYKNVPELFSDSWREDIQNLCMKTNQLRVCINYFK